MSDRSRAPFPFRLFWFSLRRMLPIWLGIAAVIFLMQIAVAGIVHDNHNVRTFLAFLNMLPSIVKTALGGDMLDSGSMSALLTVGYQHPFVMFLYMVYAICAPAGLLTAEVQRGMMELVLSRAVTKTQVYICAAVLTIAGTFALGLVMFGGTVVAVHVYEFSEAIPLDRFLRIAVFAGVLGGTFGAFALFFAAFFRRLYGAVGISAAFLTLNYFVAIIAQWWPQVAFLRRATLFYLLYYSNLWFAWPVRNMVILAVIGLAAAVAGGFVWQRRDLLI